MEPVVHIDDILQVLHDHGVQYMLIGGVNRPEDDSRGVQGQRAASSGWTGEDVRGNGGGRVTG
jgi:hypothetical protein